MQYDNILEKLDADTSQNRELLTPPSIQSAYNVDTNPDSEGDSGDKILFLRIINRFVTGRFE